MIKDVEVIDEAIIALNETGLVLKVMKGIQDYLSCKVKFSKDKKRAWLGQLHLIEILVKKFGNHVKNIHTNKMPGIPKFSVEDQKEYWSSVAMLLFLFKHSRPYTANVMRELSKANNGAKPVAFKNCCVIKLFWTLRIFA